MFTCRSCTRKTFTTLANHTLRLENTYATLHPGYSNHGSTQFRRPKPYVPASHPRKAAGANIAWDDEVDTGRVTLDDLIGAGDDDIKDTDNTSDTEIPQSTRRLTPTEWAARKHLQYLKDPLDIANQVKRSLASGKFEEAAIMTRRASRDTKVVVSWNYLIDYQLKNDRIHAALKLFNEMKKRAQLPNAQTYTTIFRGCAKSSHPKLAVSEAFRIYNVMLKSERIKPNTIHMNALLQVCARCEDLESLFSVAQTANDGLRAPNGLTYTTIFNALRVSVSEPLPKSGIITQQQIEEDERKKKQAIQRARAIWEEVIAKWRSGSIIIDEELVCAMGRILLLGGYHDADSIEALLEQTMMIPREDRVPISKPPTTTEGPNDTETDSNQFAALKKEKIMAPGAPSTSHALPGNNSLSLILSAIEKTGKTTKAQYYWEIFTKQHSVIPDGNNWHQLFVALRRGKNSGKTVSYMRDIPVELTAPKTFRTAMSTCLRDNLNHASFSNATEVLQIMLAKSTVPDMRTLQLYLRVAYANKRSLFNRAKDSGTGIKAWGRQIATALNNLWKPYMMASKVYSNDEPRSITKRELVTLARKMIAATDRILSLNSVPPESEEQLKRQRNSLNRLVVRHFEQMAEINPDFKKEEIDLEDEELEDEEDFRYFSERFRFKRIARKRGAVKDN
ncbi:hypothetical protein F5B19DRAFT_151886 [Rostrohypoxylon terebratum]|nr:hypothetical protein F5B19DRAFT_151886 [Rostrohypoxylon terebratum]